MASTQHTITTTSTTTTTTSPPKQTLYMNTGFMRTFHGIIKILEMVLCLIAFICVMAQGFPYNSIPDANYISFVTISGLIFSGLLLFLYFINAVVYLTIIPWVLLELIYSSLWCFFCLIGGIVGAVFASKYLSSGGFVAAAFFLFLAMCVYGFAAFKYYLLHRRGVRLALVTTEVTFTSTSS